MLTSITDSSINYLLQMILNNKIYSANSSACKQNDFWFIITQFSSQNIRKESKKKKKKEL